MQEIRQTFEALSPDPTVPFLNKAEERVFEARGCAGCHVTHTFEFEGEVLMPMSDFLLHETSAGFRRSTPLWGCRSCIFEAAHDWLSQTKTPN